MSGNGPEDEYDQGYDQGYDEDWEDEEYAAYEAESASVRRAKSRRLKALITVVLVVLALFWAFWWAWSYYKDDRGSPRAGSSPSAGATCAPDGDGVVAPQKITVNVYNSTARSGLAAGAAKDLGDRGFLVGTVSNDPLKKAIPGVAEVRFGPTGAGYGDLVLKTLGQGATAVPDARPESTVDVALGEGFQAVGALPVGTLPLCAAPSTSPSPSQ